MNIKYIIALALVMGLIIIALVNILPATTNVSLTNQSIDFTANNTYYPLNVSIYTASPYTPTLRYVNGTTNLGNYTYNSTHVRIGFDESADVYYGYYTYYRSAWIGGTNYSWIVLAVLIILVSALTLKMLGII